MTAIHPLHIEILETEFDVAWDMAELAARLDDMKEKFNPELKVLATACVAKMQATARALAGDRADEIYGADDDEGPLPFLDISTVGLPEEECHL